MNSRAFELAISTLVLIILGITLLIGLIIFVTGGFERFRDSTSPFLEGSQASAIKQACSLACQQSDKITFCCGNYTIDDRNINCFDSRLEINCGLDCVGYSCTNAEGD